MTDEMIDEIRKAIKEARKKKDNRERREVVRKQAEENRLEAERQALTAKNEARLRATGVVDLFEGLRDKGVLKLREGGRVETIGWRKFLGIELTTRKVEFGDYTPAVVVLSSDEVGSGISIEFDKHCRYDGRSTDDMQTPVYSFHTRLLTAKIIESGRLKIGKHEMRSGERLKDAVTDEILRVKGLKE